MAESHRLALPAGYRIENYELSAVLGKGAFGITYLGTDLQIGKRVAIKELLPDSIATRIEGGKVVAQSESLETDWEWARQRFIEEARVLAAFQHPNIVAVHRLVETNDTVYMVMDHLDGESFDARLRRTGREPGQASLWKIIGPLLEGLQEIHEVGLLHRDIKPENILFSRRGEPILIDFGAARATVGQSVAMTSIVTHGYSPIEQYQTKGRMGPWTDIYALGAVMCRAITGEKPPVAPDRVLTDELAPLCERQLVGYRAEFLQAIDWALGVRPEDRPSSIAEWRQALCVDPEASPAVLRPRVVQTPAASPPPPISTESRDNEGSPGPITPARQTPTDVVRTGVQARSAQKRRRQRKFPLGKLLTAGVAILAIVAGAGWLRWRSQAPVASELGGLLRLNDSEGSWLVSQRKKFFPVKPEYRVLGAFSEGLAPVQVGAKWGYINERQRLVIPASYDRAGSFSEGLAPVKVGSSWGFCDRSGKLAINPIYSKVSIFSSGMALVGERKRDSSIEEKLGYIDRAGRLIVEHRFGNARPFSAGLALVEVGGKWGYLAPSGATAIEPRFHAATDFTEEGAAVCLDEKWGIIDKSGRFLVEPAYDDAWAPTEGLVAIRQSDKWGYINLQGLKVITPQFDAAGPFRSGLAPVELDGRWGYVGKDGKMAIPPKYSSVKPFGQELAMVMSGGSELIIDRSGTVLVRPSIPIARK